jgi:hypothetical protein
LFRIKPREAYAKQRGGMSQADKYSRQIYRVAASGDPDRTPLQANKISGMFFDILLN